jgi:hypothetical protein
MNQPLPRATSSLHRRASARIAAALIAVASSCATAAAQVGWPWDPFDPLSTDDLYQEWQTPPEWQQLLNRPSLETQQYGEAARGLLRGFGGFGSVYPGITTPSFPGIPQYPLGFGPRQRVSGYLPAPDAFNPEWVPVPLPANRERGWPSWIKPGDDQTTPPPDAERVILARIADRVWVFAAGDTAFVPLAFYDKFRVLESGSSIEVRNQGEFLLSFHDGAAIRAHGPARLTLSELADDVAELQLRDFRRMWINAKSRPLRVLLPDGALMDLENAEMYLEAERLRGAVFNHGPKPVVWHGRSGDVEIPVGQRMDLFLAPLRAPFLPAALEVDGAVRPEITGRRLEVRGEGAGSVTWSGARFQIPAGSVVRIDPLAGSTFPEGKK